MIANRRLLGSAAVACVLLLAGLLPDLRGQNRVQQKGAIPAPRESKDADKSFTDAVTLPTDREARRLMQAAQDYIKKKEWRIASECLQSLLENREDSFLEVDGTTNDGLPEKRRVSVRTEANRLIGELPPDGLEFYQIQYGQAAETRLRDALENNDPGILAEVALRYLHTQAGAEATSLLATYHLDRGSNLMAALCFEKLLSRADADKLSPKTLFKAALAFRRAGDTASAEKVWTRLANKAARGDLMFGKQKVTVDQLRAEIDRPTELTAHLAPREAYVFRGNAARTGIGAGGAAFLEPRWNVSMTPLEDSKSLDATNWIKQNLEVAFKTLENRPILPCFFPVVTGGKVLYRTYDGVYCATLHELVAPDRVYKAGDMLWLSKTNGGLHQMASAAEKKNMLDTWFNFYRAPGHGPIGILFENALVGTLSHDTQRVYFVDDLAVPPHMAMMINMNVIGGGGPMFGPFSQDMRANQLTAVDIETGKLVWRVPLKEKESRAPSPGTATELADSFFLGPPLPLGGKLYVLVEKSSELRLICLDPVRLDAHGFPEIVWLQSLGTANLRLMQDSQRRVQAAHLAYGDGILVCPTNAGAVIGIDLLSHSLVWAFSYRDGSIQSGIDEMAGGMIINGRMRRMPMQGGSPAKERWRTSAPIIANGKVVFTAHDAGHVHCLNLRDGRLLWSVKRDDDDLYLAGVFGSKVAIVGRNYVRAVNLDDGPRETWGQPAWQLATGGPPSGQGAASEDTYYLPLQKSGEGSQAGPGILAIQMATGKKLSVAAKRNQETPGNLLFADGDIVSQTASGIAAYPQLRVKEAEITRRLKDNPADPIGLTERGELYLYDGKLNEAVVDLRAALTHQPTAETRSKARNKLHEALTEYFQSDFAKAEPYLDEYRELCRIDVPADADAAAKQKVADEQLRREASYLSLVGRGREAQGRVLDALAAYEQFGALTGNKELIGVADEANTRSRPDVWSRGRIKGMIDRASADQKKQIESAIIERFRVVRDAGPAELRTFVAVYGTSFPVGRQAQLKLAELLVAEGHSEALTEAESKLQLLCFAPDIRKHDPTVAARAIETMIRIYIRRGLYEDAVGLYKQLGDEFSSIVVVDGKTGAELLQDVLIDKRFLPYLESQGLLWRGSFKGSDLQGNPIGAGMSLTIEPEGNLLPFYDRHRLVLDMNATGNNTWTFRLLDRATNGERWKHAGLPVAAYFMIPGSPPPQFAFASGHILVTQLNNVVNAYDLAEKKALWTYNLYGKNPLYANNPQASIMLNPADGKLSIAHHDGRQERLGGIAVVQNSYVCLQTREGLVALDLTRPGPSVLWTKSGVPVKADVFGDDEHIYVVESGNDGVPTTTRALRAQDGVSVGVPDFGSLFAKRIRVLGRHLLLQEDDNEGKTCRLYDVHAGRDVWRQTFGNGAIVSSSNDPIVAAVVEKDNSVTVLDVRTGRTIFRSLLHADHGDRLQAVSLIADRERFYLALLREKDTGVDWTANLTNGLRSVRVNGPVYALNKTTGKLEWVCDFLPHQNLLLEQIRDLPVLLFTTMYSRASRVGGYGSSAKVTAIDKRTGKLIYDKDFHQNAPFLAVRTDPQAGSIELLRNDMKIAFRSDGGVASADPILPRRPLSSSPIPAAGVPAAPRAAHQ